MSKKPQPQTILPLFADYPKEAEIIGRLLAGYGELELELTECLGAVLGNFNTAIKVLFRTKGEETRIEVADAIMRGEFIGLSLGRPYSEAISDANWCRRIRNQYAHCHWDFQTPVLGFVELERNAKKHNRDWVRVRYVPRKLLAEQETYFCFVRDCLKYLAAEFKVLEGKSPSHKLSLPKKINRPPLYNERWSPENLTRC